MAVQLPSHIYRQRTDARGALANPGAAAVQVQQPSLYKHLAGALDHLAEIEIRQRGAQDENLYANVRAEAMKRTLQAREGLAEDTDYATHRQRFGADIESIMQDSGEALKNRPKLQERFKNDFGLYAMQQSFDVGRSAVRGINQNQIADLDRRTFEAEAAYGLDPYNNDIVYRGVIDDIDRLEASGALSPVEAEKRRRSAATGRASTFARLAVLNDPAAAKRDIGQTLGLGGAAGTVNTSRLPEAARSLGISEARAQGVPEDLVLAVISQESGGRADAVSKAGARGLMQLMPGTAKDLGVNPDNPEQNVKGGVTYLKQQLDRYGGDARLALAAYNWGPGNVDAWLKTGKGANGQTMPEETKNYVSRILGADITASPGESSPANPQFAAALSVLPADERMQYYAMAEREIRARQKAEGEQRKNEAYTSIYNLPPQEAVAYVTSPEGMRDLGLSADQAQDVAGMVYTNWNHKKTMEKEAREEHAGQVATQALDLAIGANGQRKDPVKALELVRNSSLDGYAKEKALKLIQDGRLGQVRDPYAVSALTSGILNGSVRGTEQIDLALLSGDISKEDHTTLRQLHADAKGRLKEALDSWESVVKDAYARSVYQNGTPSEAQAKAKALMFGAEIVRKKYQEGGIGAAQAWIMSKEAAEVLQGTQVSLRDVMQDTSRKLFGAESGTASAPPEAQSPAAREDAFARRPGESAADYHARRKLQKLGGVTAAGGGQ